MLPESNSKFGVAITFSLLSVWLVACAAGFFTLVSYSQTPGLDLVPTTLQDARVQWSRERDFLLVVAIHPRCVCSEATVTELERLLANSHEQVECRVLCYQPTTAGDDFRDTRLVKRLSQLPNTQIMKDADSLTAAMLGMKTSGAVALYDRHGEPLFVGGITTARGHEGLSAGGSAILSLVSHDRPTTTRTQVYGCPLVNVVEIPSSIVPAAEGCQP